MFQSTARVPERMPASLPGFYRSSVHLAGPEVEKGFAGARDSLAVSVFGTGDLNADKIMRSQVLRLNQLESSPIIKIDAVTSLRISNSLIRARTISELLERTVEQIGFNYRALIDFEVRTDALNEISSDLPLSKLMPNVFGKRAELLSEMQNSGKAQIETGADGENVIAMPLFNEQNRLLGAFRLRTLTKYTREELDMLQEFCITINASLNRLIEMGKLEKKAITDGLTGLYNRRFFDEFIKKEFAFCQRYQKQLGVLVIDLDHFKQVNDTHGHLAGDEVLRRVSAALRELVRTSDLAARYGGEEMVVVLPETAGDGCMKLAEKIRAAIENLEIIFDGKKIPITASIGVANYSAPLLSEVSLIQLADQAVYAAKKAGRNTVK